MSLDVYLHGPKREKVACASLRDRIFIREDGQTREITREEWDERFPEREPVVLTADEDDESEEGPCLFSANITHNLGRMAAQVDLYEPLWRPEEVGIETAAQLVEPLRAGLQRLLAERDHLEQFNPENGWGDYDGLVRFTTGYLAACEEYPDAKVRTWR